MKIEKKIDTVMMVIKIIRDFCRNRLGKTSTSQKFGEINANRQKVSFLLELINKFDKY